MLKQHFAISSQGKPGFFPLLTGFRTDIDHDKIFAFGRSLGGAVAVHLAASFPKEIKGLIIENSFTSIEDMIDVMFPVLSYFKFLCRNPYATKKSQFTHFVDG